MAAKSSSRGGATIRWVALHTNESDNPAFETTDHRAENLARWMEGQQVSYHKVVDDDSVVNFVPDGVMSWSLRSGNSRSLNVCMIGRAAWSREEWLRHDQMLRMTALIVKNWCEAHGIPKRKLSASQVGANQSGIIGHWDWTMGKNDGTHTDPGAQFPWDVFMRYVLGDVAEEPEPEQRVKKRRTEPMAPIPLVVGGNKKFRATVMAETDTKVAKLSTLTFGSTWGDTDFVITAAADGKVVGQQQKRTVKNNDSDWWDVPKGARMVTIEGTVSADGTIPSAALWVT